MTSDRPDETRKGAVLSALAASVLLWASPVDSQSSRDVVTDRISVTAVEVPVQVLRKGKPVRGLTADDFEVYDRGLLQPIVDFDVLDLTIDFPGGAPTDALGTGQPREPRVRHMMLMIDLDFTDWQLLDAAVRGAYELIDEQLHPSDRLAVGFLSPLVGAQLLSRFTTDREPGRLAVGVIEALHRRDPVAAAERLARLSAMGQIEAEGLGDDPEGWRPVAWRWLAGGSQPIGESPLIADQAPLADLPPAEGGSNPAFDEPSLEPEQQRVGSAPSLYDEQTLRRLRFMANSLRDLTRSLSGIPDPKQLLLLSSGVPSRFLQNPSHSTRVLARMDMVIKACLETGWVVQAIDVRGVPSIDEPVFDGNSLFHLAKHTGGELYENFNDLGRASERVLERSSVTYILVIQPDVEADGSFHRLEVRLKEPRGGHRLQFRPGYRAPTPGDRTANLDNRRDVAQLILAGRDVQDFEIELLAVPVPAVNGRTAVPVVVEVPGEVLLENPFGDSASVEVHVYGLDEQGGVEDLFIKRLDIDLRRSGRRLGRGGLRLLGRLRLGIGAHEVRVLVRNLANDAISMARTPVDIESVGSVPLIVMPPLFIDRSRDWLSMLVDESLVGEAGPMTMAEALGESYFPQIKPALKAKETEQLVLSFFFPDGPERPLLQIRVLTPLGEEVEGAKIRVVQRFVGADGGTGLVATLQPRDLRPGGYLLEVALVDAASGARVASARRFVVEENS